MVAANRHGYYRHGSDERAKLCIGHDRCDTCGHLCADGESIERLRHRVTKNKEHRRNGSGYGSGEPHECESFCLAQASPSRLQL